MDANCNPNGLLAVTIPSVGYLAYKSGTFEIWILIPNPSGRQLLSIFCTMISFSYIH